MFPEFLGTVVYDLPHADEPSAERVCIAEAPVLPPYLRPGLAKHGDKVIHISNTPRDSNKHTVQCRAKYLSEIVAQTGNNHKMIGALGHAKTLPGIIMGCETVAVDVNGRPFTLVVPDESVSELVTPL